MIKNINDKVPYEELDDFKIKITEDKIYIRAFKKKDNSNHDRMIYIELERNSAINKKLEIFKMGNFNKEIYDYIMDSRVI